MRVLIAHSRYLSGDASGENRVVEDEARLLADAGHEVRVYRPQPGETDGVGLLRTAVAAVWSTEAVAKLTAAVRSFAPDVVHFHNLLPTISPAGLRAVENTGTPVLMTLHNYRQMCLPSTFLRDGSVCEDCFGRTPWPGVVHRCYRESRSGSAVVAASLTLHRALRSFDRVTTFLAVSPFVRDKHIASGIDPARIRVKSNFAWPATRRVGPGERFLFLGRLSPEKGVAELVDAWRAVDAPLLVVGDGPDAERLRTLAPANVSFAGPVPASDVPGLLATARALIVPSLWYEAQPRVILEAYAAGVPVIASRIGGLPDLVEDGGTGALVTPGDAGSLAAAARILSSDPESERLGSRAYDAWRERYSPEHAIVELEAAYRDAS